MTYNFDPDRWYDNELAVIELELKTGKLSESEYNKAVEVLDQQYHEMWSRLD
ncbi:MAG: hypothetical protein JRH15_09775, partial [Deltaproteobacteria bacterium]|nr:hypothetical protein [Deltaproteobacteria bacterium]